MKAFVKRAVALGASVLYTECRDERWIISALGLGTARCPERDVRSSRRHGWQIRQLQDLPVQGS